jgi:hypothetical protein
MAVNSSRSQRRSFLEGSVDGKYRKVRPDTEVAPGTGGENVRLNRSHLHAPLNYDFAAEQIPLEQMEYPGA